MPCSWPNKDIYHQASLWYNETPMTVCLFAPMDTSDHRAVYNAGAYTLPSWRRLGLYSFLIDICVNHWRTEDKYDWFKSGFNKGNEASRMMQFKQGREFYEERATHVRTRLSLRPTGDEFDLTAEMLQPMLSKIEALSG